MRKATRCVRNKPKRLAINGHFDIPPGDPRQPGTKREYERYRYLEVNAPVYGFDAALERWNCYEQLILAKYGDNIDAASRARSCTLAPMTRLKYNPTGGLMQQLSTRGMASDGVPLRLGR